MDPLPLQVVDSFLLGYNVGDALLVAFVLGLVATVPTKSWKLLTLHLLTFGLVFFLTPSSLMAVDASGSHLLASPLQYKLVGLGLLFVSPVLYTTADQ